PPTNIAIFKFETRLLFTACTSLSVEDGQPLNAANVGRGSNNHTDEATALRRAWNSTHENVSHAPVSSSRCTQFATKLRQHHLAPKDRQLSQQRRAINGQHAPSVGGEVQRLTVRAQPRVAFVGLGVQSVERHD